LELPDADRQAASFQRLRACHQGELAEDYVELIADLTATQGEARAVDIAQRLGVAHPTVVKAIARLQREGLVSSQPYRAVFLTEKGKELAARSRRRHQVVYSFLRSLGISEEIAQTDAEGMEHHVSDETLAALERLIGTKAAGGSG
jgi:DtxR family manganese transport transcriptional regulator